MHWKKPSKGLLRGNCTLAARICLSTFLILILVIQTIALNSQALAFNDTFVNLLLPSPSSPSSASSSVSASSPSSSTPTPTTTPTSSLSSSSTSAVNNKNIPLILPGNKLTTDDVSSSAAAAAVTDQYIVILDEESIKFNAAGLNQEAYVKTMEMEIESMGAEITHVYDSLSGYVIKPSPEISASELVKELSNDPRVAYVEADQKVRAFAQTLPTGVDRADGDLSFMRSGDGTGSANVDIALLDSGIDLTHPDLNVYRATTFVDGTSTARDDNGHGTLVAGVAAAKDNSIGVVGMAPGARLWAVKVLDKTGSGFVSDIIAGIDYLVQHANEVDVANLSFGCACSSQALDSSINTAVAAGITFVASAGNDNKDARTYLPANNPNVLAASAIVDTDGKCGAKGPSTSYGTDDRMASFSNYGSTVDVAAPGVAILSTSLNGGLAKFSGTSAATPHVTGGAALYMGLHPDATPAQVKSALVESSLKPSTLCDGNSQGYFTGEKDSSPEPLLSVKQIQPSDTTPPPATTSCGKLTPTAVTANGNDGNVPSNVLDNNANTRWSNNGVGSWIQLDLGSKKSICSVDIAWYRGSVGRQNNFVISTSDDGTNFVNKLSAKSSGALQKYNMPAGTEGRYVRITVNGNNENNWASITEIAVFGSDSTTPPGPNQPPTADSKSITTSMNTPVDVTLSGQDPESGPLTFSIVDQPTHGTLGAVTSQGIVKYTPATGYTGADSFTYVSRDDKGATSSSKATVSITVTQSQPPPASCGKLTPTAVTANGNDGNVPSNVLDNNANTRWSNNAVGSWIQLDLGSKKSICSVDIAWYRGSVGRQNNFVISTSDDGTNFVNKLSTKSSGTTSSLEKYNMPAGTEGRYVRITVNGNNENNWASITEIAVFGSDSTTPPGPNQPPTADSKSVTTSMNTPVDVTLSGQDPEGGPLTFSTVDQPTHGTLGAVSSQGIVKYTPNAGYIGPDSFTYTAKDDKGATSSSKAAVSISVLSGDTGTNEPSMSRNSDGSWRVTSGQVRYGVFTSSGYQPGNVVKDHSVIANRGYMQSPNDWKNVEMTGQVKYNSGGDDEWTWYARGGRHTGSGWQDGCEGVAYKGSLAYTGGQVRWAKEQWHVSYVFQPWKNSPADGDGKFVGFKVAIYNMQLNGKTVVKMESWVDPNNNNQWQKVYDFIDQGGWGSEGDECRGDDDQIVTWGGPIAAFRWDDGNSIDIKNLSVREIVPPTQ